jgi:hypothetical protein
MATIALAISTKLGASPGAQRLHEIDIVPGRATGCREGGHGKQAKGCHKRGYGSSRQNGHCATPLRLVV